MAKNDEERIAELEKEIEHLKIDARLRVKQIGKVVTEARNLRTALEQVHLIASVDGCRCICDIIDNALKGEGAEDERDYELATADKISELSLRVAALERANRSANSDN